jgi:hypothetical protein
VSPVLEEAAAQVGVVGFGHRGLAVDRDPAASGDRRARICPAIAVLTSCCNANALVISRS